MRTKRHMQTKRCKRHTKRKQRGGALYCRKPTIAEKIAEGMSMALSGPAPTFITLGTKLAGQAFKGVKDNYRYYKGRH